ncbi:hypothetical protein Tco_1388973 [Tanacetum coccineum]
MTRALDMIEDVQGEEDGCYSEGKKGLMRLWLSESLEGIAAVKKLQRSWVPRLRRSWVPRLRRSWSSSIKGCPGSLNDGVAHPMQLRYSFLL